MKITNIEAFNLSQALSPLMTKELPYKVALKVSKNAKALDEIIKEFAQDEKELLEKYSKKNDDGSCVTNEDGSYQIEDKENFAQDRQALYDFENEINLHSMSESDLESVSLTPIQVMSLETIFQ